MSDAIPIPGAPRNETKLYYADGTSFGSQRAEPALVDAPELGRRVMQDDLLAIAERAMDQRELHGDEAFRLGDRYLALRSEIDDGTEMLASALREQLRLQHLLTLRDAELATVRRQLSMAREQLAAVQISAPVTYVSYEDLTAQWRDQDRREQADLERRQRIHARRGRMMLDTDEKIVIEIDR